MGILDTFSMLVVDDCFFFFGWTSFQLFSSTVSKNDVSTSRVKIFVTEKNEHGTGNPPFPIGATFTKWLMFHCCMFFFRKKGRKKIFSISHPPAAFLVASSPSPGMW